eukprot:CAMPEP_0113418646 /NCGR_PEP_ID=MMETSP0013_2-20120614/26326_1 /TAXON_ID=2843 ORGANISM="Skeletonema costatum, Strain 1716" /NCGR_SAMPLE_ID=MMETSP0013_2 /ASSEMBLY_ACC=CAM_ASM_000158 /LENGTH=246 /DNA_ID=CAMNT_0000305913 /DNA_START=81 /DNA_END=821 /DNA_ORIENTATION=- /assembly_acc=CAM_ASM_000158
MTSTNDFNTPDANEAGVEMIIPDTAVTATEESNVLDAAAAPPKPKWTTKGVSIAGIGALCVMGGVVYFLAGSPTSSSQQQQMQQTAIEATLEQFGGDNVQCRDSQSPISVLYPYIGYVSVSSAEECGDKCSMCPGNDQGGLVLRGFNYDRAGTCYCLVDFDSNGFEKTVCAGADFASDTNKGSGEIVNTSPRPGVQCWKVSSPSSSKARKSSKAPKSSKRPVRKLGQKNDNLLSNVERKTDSQTII